MKLSSFPKLPAAIFYSVCTAVIITAFISCRKPEALKPSPSSPWLPVEPYVYPNGNNAITTLGRVLFYDKNLSLDRSVACGSCHQQANGFADNKQFSTGFGGNQTTRNALAIINTNNSHFWDGKAPGSGYSNTVSFPFKSHAELNMTDPSVLTTRLSELIYYHELFNKAFGVNASITMSGVEQALGAFMDNIISTNSRYDQAYPPANSGLQASITLTPQELAGLTIFTGKGKCASCHNPNNGFGGFVNQFEDIGLDASYTDLGRATITGFPGDQGKFQVPSLKNIGLSAPYMHDGRFKTLDDVVNFFSENINSSPNLSHLFTNSGGSAAPLMLSAVEKHNLVIFLLTLTDQSLVTDVRYSNPFNH